MAKVVKEFYFRKSKENAELAGTIQQHEVPEFNWEEFKNLPNAKLFVERCFNSFSQKLVRDVLLEKNGTAEHHLQSIESVIARSIRFTKQEILDWCMTRDWENA